MTSEQKATDANNEIKTVEIIILKQNGGREFLLQVKKFQVPEDTLKLTASFNGPRWRALIGLRRARVTIPLGFVKFWLVEPRARKPTNRAQQVFEPAKYEIAKSFSSRSSAWR